jgi:hypothetical protein
MDDFSYEVLNCIGSFLPLKSIVHMRRTCLAFYNALYKTHMNILDNLEWRITTRILFRPIYNDYIVENVNIVIGNVTFDPFEEYSHDICNNNYSFDYHVVYIIVEDGKGGDILRKIISHIICNKYDENMYVPISVINDVDNILNIKTEIHNNGAILANVKLGDLDTKSNLQYSYDKILINGDIRYNNNNNNNNHNNYMIKSENDLGDYDLSRYRDGIYVESANEDSDTEWSDIECNNTEYEFG